MPRTKSETFRFRLTDLELARLEQERVRGRFRSKADLIRDRLGWPLSREIPPLPPAPPPTKTAHKASAKLAERVTANGESNSDTEPGRTAIESLARKIRNRDGLTMPLARRKAKKELQNDANES